MGTLLNNRLSCHLYLLLVTLNWALILPCCVGYHHAPESEAGYGYSESSNQPPEDEAYAEEIEYGPPEYYNPYHDSRVVDNKGRYTLEWTVDYSAKTITFNMTVRTVGWVGLGLSKDGKMKDADIMIGWVGVNGEGYLMDLHADYNRKLGTDTKQNWKLLASSEVYGVTYLLVTRPLDTCDPYDYPITVDLAWVLWAYGETDVLEYHFDKRGAFRAYLMDPVLETYEPHLEMFRVANQVTLDAEKTTTYMCSIHKGPHLMHKHHMVEFHAYLGDELSVRHTHHMLVYRCVAPPGMNAKDIFELLVGFPGEECYFNDNHVIPTQLCKLEIVVWGLGGNPIVLPYSTGIAMGEEFNEYYMLEVHFDNPEGLPLTLSAGIDIYYTNKLRKNDGGNILVAYDVFGLFMIPPISTNFEVYGFCTENCSQSIVPADGGFEILSVLLHTHVSGRKIKLQHFRNGYELEWILKDDNFDATFQQQRVLYEPRTVLPGDLLVIKCEYDNTGRNGTTLSGTATRNEMCFAGLTISKRVPYLYCFSQVPAEKLLSLIGVEEVEWDTDSQQRIVTLPEELAGNFLSTVTDNLTDWTKELRYKIQQVQLYTPSDGTCPQILIPTESTTTGRAHHVSHGHSSTSNHGNSAHVKEQRQKMLGTVISSTADVMNILTLAKGYGDTTLMGENVNVPNRTPGPYSTTVYPNDAERYNAVRTCPRVAPTPYYLNQNTAYASSSTAGGGGYGYQASSYSSYPTSG